MAITIALDDHLAAALESGAKKSQFSVEQFIVSILAEAVEQFESATPHEVVAKIKATPLNPLAVRPAMPNLAEALRDSPGDTRFNLDSWTRRWADVQRELKSLTRANDVAEGRGE